MFWGKSVKQTKRDFLNVPGVRRFDHGYRYDASQKRHIRKYTGLLIPRAVLDREIRRVTVGFQNVASSAKFHELSDALSNSGCSSWMKCA